MLFPLRALNSTIDGVEAGINLLGLTTKPIVSVLTNVIVQLLGPTIALKFTAESDVLSVSVNTAFEDTKLSILLEVSVFGR